jgi:hypothetical protein
MHIEAVLAIISGIISLVGVGSLVGIVTSIKRWGASEERHRNEIENIRTTMAGNYEDLRKYISNEINQINSAVTRLDRSVGNGGGLTHEIKTMQLNCAGQMTGVKKELEDHLKQPGHNGSAENIADLRARVINLERKENEN